MTNPINDALFPSELWKIAFEKYATAANLTVLLFDARERPVLGPLHLTPLFELFDAKEYNARFFARCARAALGHNGHESVVQVSQFHGLAAVSAPLALEGKVVGAAVAGYVFTEFSQVTEIHWLTRDAGISFERLWAVARQQQPVPERRLVVLGELLQTLGEALLRENLRTRQYQHAAAIVASSGDAIISENLFGVITAWNPGAERLYGYSADEVLGKHITSVLNPPGRMDEEPDILQRIRDGESVQHYDTVRRRKDGVLSEISLTVSPITDGRGRIVGASNIARDITARKRAEEGLARATQELAEANAELEGRVQERTAKLQELVGDLEHFSYTITHDLKSPLRAMRGFAELAIEMSGEGTTRPFLEKISTSAERMDQLITDALNYSRAVRQELPLEDVDAGALLRGILDSYPEFQPSRADIRLEGKLPVVLGNAAGLTQCFSNLLGNAVKFVRPGQVPEVRVWAEEVRNAECGMRNKEGELIPTSLSAERESTWARIWVEDKGIGVPRELLPRVFDMFSRGSKDYDGTGIGLALVRKVVKRMGGRVGVESAEGNGSRFWMELKWRAVQPRPEAAAVGSSEPKSGTVLYVDDEEGDQMFMGRAFAEKGMQSQFRVVGDGRAAIEYLSGAGKYANRKEYPLPAVVLLDLNLPLVPGFEVLKWMRKHPDFARTPVVVFSSSTGEDDRVKARELGANEFVAKPSSGLDFGKVLEGLRGKRMGVRTAV